MSEVPTSVYSVRGIRNSGWPLPVRAAPVCHRQAQTGTGGDAYGHAVPVVVDGVTPIQGERESRSQGEAGQEGKEA